MVTNFDKAFYEAATSWFDNSSDESKDTMLNILYNDKEAMEEEKRLAEETYCIQTYQQGHLFQCICPSYKDMYQLSLNTADDVYSHDKVIKEALEHCVHCSQDEMLNSESYGFIGEFLDIVAYHISQYDTPEEFFEDLSYGGCASGMIGEFIYNSDCKDFYIKYMCDLDDYIENIEEEIGCRIYNKSNGIARYVLVCWVAFEEFCRILQYYLFENFEG